MKPFRWDVSKIEQLGRLIDTSSPGPDPQWLEAIATAATKVVVRSNDADLVFVGRSPENWFDYLSGVFAGTSREQRAVHLNYSNRDWSMAEIRSEAPEAYAALCDHMRTLRLDPAAMVNARHGVCFVDLVHRGYTFGHLFTFLHDWAIEEGVDTKQLFAKTNIVGITLRTKTSPNTWRWQQHLPWVKEFGLTQIKNVSIPAELWMELGNTQPKVTPSNHHKHWTADTLLGPDRSEDTLQALQLAHNLYRLGAEQRREFSRRLAQSEGAKLAWVRDLMAELR